MKSVKSSNIVSIHYNPDTKVLEVTFKNNKFYHYSNVTQKTYDTFKDSHSLGEFLHKSIKPYHSVLKKG